MAPATCTLLILLLLLHLLTPTVLADPLRTDIHIDGNFDEWQSVPSRRSDPAGWEMDALPPVPDVHDTDVEGYCGGETAPVLRVNNSRVDVLEFAMAHDKSRVYAYFRATGKIGETQVGNSNGSVAAGRAYLQIAMNMDNNDMTGYCTYGGGYLPNACGSDMAFEIEMYNGSVNTGHVLLHARWNGSETSTQQEEQKQGVVTLAGPAQYKNYTQWVYWTADAPPTAEEAARCTAGQAIPEGQQGRTEGPYTLPSGATICFVSDKCNGRFTGALQYAFSPDFTQLELSIPFEAFMKTANGTALLSLGKSVMVQGTMETSPELCDSTPKNWASDATFAFAYHFDAEEGGGGTAGSSSDDSSKDGLSLIGQILVPIGALLLGVMGGAWVACFVARRRDYEEIEG